MPTLPTTTTTPRARSDIFDKATQQQLLDSCKYAGDSTGTGHINAYPCDLTSGCYDGKLIRVGSVICFMEEFIAWHNANKGGAPANSVDNPNDRFRGGKGGGGRP